MANQWTDEQMSAIQTAPNVLVSAAAGSGKTAVLVERIIRKLIPDENGNFTDITRLLVVTFARDAAGEMQERIKKALNTLMHNTNDMKLKRHFKNQLKLVGQADITTIDAFCINAVRRNFHYLDIDPTFRIMDKAEADILKYRLADELCMSKYEEDDEDFMLLNMLYSSAGSDYKLIKILIDLYEFTRSLPYPDKWLDDCVKIYNEPFSGSMWEKYAVSAKNNVISETLDIFRMALKVLNDFIKDNSLSDYTQADDEFVSLYDNIKISYDTLKQLKKSDYDSSQKILSGNTFSSPQKSRKKNETAAFINEIIDIIRTGYELISDITPLFSFSSDGHDEIARKQVKVISALTSLCKEFSEIIINEKIETNTYEFNDLEHMCLKLFSENPLIAEEYRDKYDEILMDEYQDTNGLQEAIFDSVSKEHNRFMVGDMKQSIYRFRSSDPMIFKSKLSTYSADAASGNAIALTKNFRSRREVLNSVNDIFINTMFEDTAEIEYDTSQQLNCGNTKLSDNRYKPDIYTSEFHIIEATDTEDEEETLQISEARYVASKIRELLDSDFKVLDGDEFRQIKKSDIAILSSAVKSLSDDYVRILAEAGIEASIQCGGFLDRSEIRLVCSIMSLICNPLQDIPLISVLRSPLFSFSDDLLAKIRLYSDGHFFEALNEYAKLTECKKCNSFLSTLKSWRELSKYTDSNRFLWTVYTNTGLYDMAGILYDNDAQANLRLLTEMAKAYESGGYKGIYNFSSYIEMLKKNEVDIESVSSGSDNDSVRIMTIHKSKGLEFPVVFLVGACKKFNRDTSSISLHKDFGISLPYSDYETRKTAPTIQTIILNKIKSNEETAECMRRLYVGVTRAKEKLIITGSVSSAVYDESGIYKSGGITGKKNVWNINGFKNHSNITSVSNYADWIAPCAIASENWKFIEASAVTPTPEKPVQADEDKEYFDYITQESINKLLERKYGFLSSSDVPSRMYVTQIKNMNNYIPDVHREPDFMSEKTLSGAKIGNAYHKVLLYIDIAALKNKSSVDEQIDIMVQNGFLSENEKSYLDTGKITALFDTDIGKEMSDADLKRETPFELMVPAGEIFTGSTGDILVQGIIDCWFIDKNGDIVLIDYKSDYVKDINELKNRYEVQLKWYQTALERILHKKVARKYIYSLSKNEYVML